MGFLGSFLARRRFRHIREVMDREMILLRELRDQKERSGVRVNRYLLALPEELRCQCRWCRRERRQIRAEAERLYALDLAEVDGRDVATQAVA